MITAAIHVRRFNNLMVIGFFYGTMGAIDNSVKCN